jgi:hypothetical protein
MSPLIQRDPSIGFTCDVMMAKYCKLALDGLTRLNLESFSLEVTMHTYFN